MRGLGNKFGLQTSHGLGQKILFSPFFILLLSFSSTLSSQTQPEDNVGKRKNKKG